MMPRAKKPTMSEHVMTPVTSRIVLMYSATILESLLFGMVDGSGFWLSLSGADYGGYVAIDHSVSPNRIWVADTENNRVLGWSSITVFAAHGPANIVIGQSDITANACNVLREPESSPLCREKCEAIRV
jgi:hypothetical protein